MNNKRKKLLKELKKRGHWCDNWGDIAKETSVVYMESLMVMGLTLALKNAKRKTKNK